ncbi:MAG TPA: sigma-70 family RNA polymerase sigma factor [Anaerolineales bacterium]|nr:sigma-70 family RNA polymerase sigma factor [Anaerolineales bacterium]
MNSVNDSSLYGEVDLVGIAARGDLEAFNQLVLRYQSMAYNYAYALLGDSAQAEDATQESFIKAFQGMNAFRGGSFRSWLLKIVTNSAYDMLRRSHRHPTQPLIPEDENGEAVESPAWLADPGPSVETIVEQNELSGDVYKVLDDLPDVFRSALTLVDLYELDYVEAAATLRIPIGTLKSRLARGRLQMKDRLKSIGVNPPPISRMNSLCTA